MKTILVTGAAQGIGLALCTNFLQKGYKVIATDYRPNLLQQTFLANPSVHCFELDVSKYSHWENLLQILRNQSLLPDILVNNAGVIRPGLSFEISEKDISEQLDINTKGLIYGTRVFGGMMKERGSGHIINIASLAGIAAVYGFSVYCASKFAARGFSFASAQELSEFGVDVSCICPDGVKTPMLESMASDNRFAMAFSGTSLLETADVVKAVNKAIAHKNLEIVLPTGRGWISKFANFNIGWGVKMKNYFLKIGAKNREKYLKELGLTDNRE